MPRPRAVGENVLRKEGFQKVTGFVTFHIDSADGKSLKTMTGHFVNQFATLPGSSSGGTPSDLIAATPQLVQ